MCPQGLLAYASVQCSSCLILVSGPQYTTFLRGGRGGCSGARPGCQKGASRDGPARKAQPMHIDSALQALGDQSLQSAPSASDQTYLGKNSVTPDSTVESKGSQLPVCDYDPYFSA